MKELLSKIKDDYPGVTLRRLEEEFHRFFFLQNLNGLFSENLAQKKFITLLEKGTPFEYINREAYFYNSSIYVDERVLIPRYETEGLVEILNDLIKKDSKVCEVGIGSGALMVALLKETLHCLEYWGLDLSQEALEVARFNELLHKYSWGERHRINILESDRLRAVEGLSFDIIVSNPPYIKRSQKKSVHQRVYEYEPDIALFLEDDEYDKWFTTLFEQSSKMAPILLLEGHEDNLKDLSQIASHFFSSQEIRKDLTKRDRYLILKTA